MNPFVIGLLVVVIPVIVSSILKKKHAEEDKSPVNQARDTEARAKYQALCEEGETLQTVCRGYQTEYYAMTDRRLIIDNKKGLQSVPFESIRKVDFFKMGGGKAATASDCQVIAVHADKKYSMACYSGNFEQIAGELMRRYR